MGFLKYEFYNKLLDVVILFRVTSVVILSNIVTTLNIF